MNISQVAQASGLPVKTIRYYEDIGLITPDRSANGYRSFSDKDIETLTFLARSRALGFSIEDCRLLLRLYADEQRSSADVKQLAQQHLDQIDEKIAHLESMRTTLQQMVQRCAGDAGPDCPILSGLACDQG
jgi:Cu(I)-responsive transcriptional regulator